MRVFFVALAFSSLALGRLDATVPRCAGFPSFQVLTTKSGEPLQLPVASVPNTLDYEVQIAGAWSVVADGTFHLRGTLLHRSFRSPDAAPVIRETFYATSDSQSVYIVVTARNGSQFLCAQDFQVLLDRDQGLARNATRMIIPVAGSVRGANNSVFKTRVVIENRWSDPITGKLVFHPAGTPGSSSDPSLAYSLPAGAFIAYDDVVESLHASGLGSLDVIPDAVGSGVYPEPVVRADVISLAPGGGEYSASLPVVTSTSAYEGAVLGSPRFLVEAPRNKRLAVGVRSLADPVTVSAFLLTPERNTRARTTRSYAAESYEQTSLSTWFDDQQQPGDTIEFVISRTSGQEWVSGAIIFIAETDNVTNDLTILTPQTIGTLQQPIIACSSGSGCGTLVR